VWLVMARSRLRIINGCIFMFTSKFFRSLGLAAAEGGSYVAYGRKPEKGE